MKIKTWQLILGLVLLTFIWGLAYVIPQQILRRGANDPQLEIARESAGSMAEGEVPDFLLKNPNKVDIAKSDQPYLIIFDSNKKVMASTAVWGTQDPVPPLGVLDYAKKHGVDKVTWAPASGVRQAIVALPFNGKHSGYVVVGRNLVPTEKKEDWAFKFAFSGWIVSIIAVISLLSVKNRKRLT